MHNTHCLMMEVKKKTLYSYDFTVKLMFEFILCLKNVFLKQIHFGT